MDEERRKKEKTDNGRDEETEMERERERGSGERIGTTRGALDISEASAERKHEK